MRFLIADTKRAFSEKSFFTTIFAGVLCIAISALVTYMNGYDTPLEFFKFSHGLMLPFVAPLLAALPYSNMNMIEEQSNYERFMVFRQGKKRWEMKRFFVNGTVGGVAICVPTVLLFAVSYAMGLRDMTTEIFLVIGLNFLFGFAFASLSYGLTFVNREKYIPLVAPQVLYLFMIYTFPYIGLERFYPPLSFSPWILASLASLEHITLFLLIVTAVAIVLVFMGRIKKTQGFTLLMEGVNS